jgi:hypothetical protein
LIQHAERQRVRVAVDRVGEHRERRPR